MMQIHRLLATALILAAGLQFTSTASAGPLLDWLVPDDGPTPSYSPLRYWAPAVARVNDHFHGPALSPYAPDRHPEVPPTFIILAFPRKAPAADPGATIVPVPTAPATSRAH